MCCITNKSCEDKQNILQKLKGNKTLDNVEVYRHIDHTLLKAFCTTQQIETIAEEALKYGTASICIPPSFVNHIHNKYKDVNICTVIGFPLGYSATAVKIAEAKQAIADGASEIDMVINITWAKEHRFDDITAEIKAVKAACKEKILKVIIETCYLTDDEKIALCKCVSDAKADYIKTSTGFGTGGATLDDVKLLKAHVAPYVKVKAAGGMKVREDLFAFLEAGADRLGTSSGIKLLNE